MRDMFSTADQKVKFVLTGLMGINSNQGSAMPAVSKIEKSSNVFENQKSVNQLHQIFFKR